MSSHWHPAKMQRDTRRDLQGDHRRGRLGHGSPQRGSPYRRTHASPTSRRDCSPDREVGEKRARSYSHDDRGSHSSPSPSPKKRKKEKQKKSKKKKRHKENRSKHKKKRKRRSRSPSTCSSGHGSDTTAQPAVSPSKHRSRVTVVESPQTDESRSLCSTRSDLVPPPRLHSAKLMAAAEQRRRIEGPNVGRVMSKAERLDRQRAAVQTDPRRGAVAATAPRHGTPIKRPVESVAENPVRPADRTKAATGVFGNMVPRSIRTSGAATKKGKTATCRSTKRPVSSAAAVISMGPAVPSPAAPRLDRQAAPVKTEVPQHMSECPAQAGHLTSTGCVACCECEDQPADVHCIQCDEPFCRPCWGGQHRRGKRSMHNLQPILGELLKRADQPAEPCVHPQGELPVMSSDESALSGKSGAATQDLDAPGTVGPALPPGGMAALYTNDSERRLKTNRERVRWLPLRLTEEERSLLTLLQGALHHSEYTDQVDVFAHTDKVQRQLRAMQDYMQTQCGLQLANKFKIGQRLVQSNLRVNQDFFACAFEVGRRYKVMNPQKMRSDYGKMMYLLMDSQRPDVAEVLKINLVKPIQTVGQLLHAKRGEGILASEDLDDATRDLSDDTHKRSQLLILQQQKREAVDRILDKFSSKDLSRDEIMRVLDSISDANNFLANNETPVTRMLDILKTNFDMKGPKGNVKGGDFSLAIGRGGNFRSGGGHSFYGGNKKFTIHSMGSSSSGGAKLTHSHSTQFAFTSQTFMLWHQISKHMYKLWIKADHDMLHNPYRLQNTGQGLNRVQQCPQVSKEMHRILHCVQQRCGGHWVGLSVIHLGDRDVPNALTFIDKYTQVPRILAPIVSCIEQLDRLSTSKNTAQYIRLNGGAPRVKMQILSDFFKHGFDGSGDDGGSCIDGRLTSSWNWCSKIEKKRYYNIFLLAGFRSFN